MTNDDDKIRFTFRLPVALFEEIKNKARQQGISTNSFILEILRDWLDKNN